uniref:Cytochrome P450 CYP9Z18 n=1 Tax=Dendroctonus valens TaxID=77173 RepID=M1NEC6_DENVA|nr:cytochrome P450 CYP9Z18 [Dendroctonus valens]
MIWLIAAGVAAFLLWYSFIWPLNRFTRMGVKQTKPWPVFGDQWTSLFKVKSVSEHVSWIYDMHPDTRYTGLYQFATPSLMLRDPELIKQITVKDFDHFTDHRKFVEPESDPIRSGNLFALKGTKWREMRATLSGSFTSSKMKHMFDVINETAENFSKHFARKNDKSIEIELKDVFTKYANDIIATSAFGIQVNSLADPKNTFYNMGETITDFSGFLNKLRFITLATLPTLAKYLRLTLFPRNPVRYFRDIIHDTIKVRIQKSIVRKDMLNLLLDTRKGITNEEEGVIETGFATVKEFSSTNKPKAKEFKYLSDDDITSQALIFFFAGFDTVSTSLCFATYEIAINPDIQDRLREEIIETDKANNGKLTYDALLKMKYMDMVFSEALRKWPPVPSMDRECTKSYTIQPVRPDEKPVHLKPGDVLMLPMMGLHRDPRYYANPEKFDPERFSDENKDNIIPYTYIPFGSGPRNCIGSRFAILEAKAVLYHLLLNFKIEPTERLSVPLKLCRKTFKNTAEGGYWLRLRKIEN